MKREWLSKDLGIYYTPGGGTAFRGTVEGLGRREIALSKTKLALKDAIRKKDARVAELRGVKRLRQQMGPRFEELASEIREEKRAKSFKTFESALIHFNKHLIPWFNDNYPHLERDLWNEKGETIWQEYINEKRKSRPGMKFLNHRKHLRMVLKRAFERGILSRKVTLYDPDPAIDAGKVLSVAEIKGIYRASSPTLKDQVMMAYTMGFRKSEILRLEWSRVNLATREIALLKANTKTRKPRVVPMNKWVHTMLTKRQKDVRGPYVFWSRADAAKYQASNKTAWKAAKRRAGVTARFHDLRHTFITNAVRAGMNPILICKYAGVSQEVMATVYCHLDSTDLRRVAGELGEKLGAGFKG